MSEKVKVAVISGILGIIGGIITGTSATNAIQNNTTKVYVSNQNESELSAQYNAINEENRKLKDELSKINSLNTELEARNNQFVSEANEKLQKYQNEQAELKLKIQELETQNAQLDAANTSLIAQLQNAPVIIPETIPNEPDSPIPDEYEIDNSTTLLCNMSYTQGRRMRLHSIEKDNLGNEQTNVIYTCDNTFQIDGEYQTISGTLFIPEDKKNYAKPHLMIYGDDDQIYNIQLEPGDLPHDFSVDISGINKLTVKIYSNTGLAECRLYKN